MTPTARRIFPSGAWEVSAVIQGHLVCRVYYGYTKREALSLFRQDYESFGATNRQERV